MLNGSNISGYSIQTKGSMIDHSIKIESVITKPGENSGGAKNFWVQTYKSKPNKKIDEIMTMRISRQEITFLRHLDAKI